MLGIFPRPNRHGRPGGSAGRAPDLSGRLPLVVALGVGAGAATIVVGAARRTARLGTRIRWSPPSRHLSDTTLATATLGHGLPATVLLHGLFSSGQYWGADFDTLASDTLLVVPDLAGFGRSVEVVTRYGPDDHAELVTRCLVQLGAAERPSVIGAHSLGCLVALRLAALRPDLVSAVVGFAPPLYATPDDALRCLARASAVLRLFVLHEGMAEAVCDWMCDHPVASARPGRLIRPDLPAPLAEDRLRHTYRSYSETVAKVIVAAGAPSWLDQVRVPVHFVAGDRDRIVDRAFLGQLAARHANVKLSVWEGGAHEIPLTHPQACVAELRRIRGRVTAEPRPPPVVPLPDGLPGR